MKKVLIIEDDPLVAGIYQTRLSKDGFQVEVASDGQTGFYRTYEIRPDAILLDLMLPNMDGLQILKKMRVQKQFQKTPIIVYTSSDAPETMKDALNAGATCFFNKAETSPGHICEKLRSFLGPIEAPQVPIPSAAPEKSVQPPPPPPPLPPAPIASSESDTTSYAKISGDFFTDVPAIEKNIRKAAHRLARATKSEHRILGLMELYQEFHNLSKSAELIGLDDIARLGAVMEGMLEKMRNKPSLLTDSITRTLVQSIDFLAELMNQRANLGLLLSATVRILVVDDDAISLRTIRYQLEKAQMVTDEAEDAEAANKMLDENIYDLIVLDVEMPGMTGHELCKKLRLMPSHKDTPVLFVTGRTDLDVRALAFLSGGNDLISKSRVSLELTIKVLTIVLKHRYAFTKI